MGDRLIYLDHSATTKLDARVLEEMMPYLRENYGNASSMYTLGRQSFQALELARQRTANVLNCSAKEIYFTGSGSESDNLAIKGIAYANRKKGNHIITSKIEHSAVLNTCKRLEKEGYIVTYLHVDKEGKILIEELKKSIKDNTILLSFMFANNEIGTIQDIETIGQIAKENGIYFHTDAVQAIGNIKIDVQKLNIDALSMSAHKFYGPKGVGALYIRNGIMFDSIINGGHQENGKRAGTENVAGIVGLGKAIEIADLEFEEYNSHLLKLRNRYIEEVENRIEGCRLNGHRIDRLPGNANFSFENVDGGDLLLMLDIKGICASSGSACTSGIVDVSNVLNAIGVSKEFARGTLRTTWGKENTINDVEVVVDNLVEIIDKLRKNV